MMFIQRTLQGLMRQQFLTATKVILWWAATEWFKIWELTLMFRINSKPTFTWTRIYLKLYSMLPRLFKLYYFRNLPLSTITKYHVKMIVLSLRISVSRWASKNTSRTNEESKVCFWMRIGAKTEVRLINLSIVRMHFQYPRIIVITLIIHSGDSTFETYETLDNTSFQNC